MKQINIFLFVCAGLLLVPAVLIVSSWSSYDGSHMHDEVVLSEDEALSLLSRRVMQDYHYRELGGHDLRLVSLERPPLERCTGLWRDYFGTDDVFENCYAATFSFDVNDSAPSFVTAYTARTYLLGDEVKGFEISERLLVVTDFESCKDAGYPVFFPDCAGCRSYCVGPFDERFVLED